MTKMTKMTKNAAYSNGWISTGSIKVKDEVFHYSVKHFAEVSDWGIDGGRISKLSLKRNGEWVCNYDRGWDIKPADENTEIAYQLLIDQMN